MFDYRHYLLKKTLFFEEVLKMNTVGGYVQNEIAGMNEAELEIRALIRTASALNEIKENWDSNNREELTKALDKNRRLWSILASEMKEEDCPQPLEIKQNIINLANFIQKKPSLASILQAVEWQILSNFVQSLLKRQQKRNYATNN